MLRYGKKSDYGDRVPPDASTKVYQHLFLRDHLPRFVERGSRILEVGANLEFGPLLALEAAERWVADPYDGVAGGGADHLPELPPNITLSRCTIGVNSQSLPSGYFDLVFSSSVLEHVGQREVLYDCFPVKHPPAAQEVPRQRLCRELFRITRPGGVQIHAIDHGARNLSFVRNFLDAGFAFLRDDPPFTLRQMMHDPNAVRQIRGWTDPSQLEPWPELHSVLLLGFRKPHGEPVQTSLPPTGPIRDLVRLFYGRLHGRVHALWSARRRSVAAAMRERA